MKHTKIALRWAGCLAFALAYGAFVGYSLDEQVQIEQSAIITANK